MTTTTATTTKPTASAPASASAPPALKPGAPITTTPPAIRVQPKPSGMRPSVKLPAKTAAQPHAAAMATASSSITPPAALGQGVNTFFNSGVSTAVNPGTPASGSGSETVSYQVCQSIEEVYEALDISADVSLSDLVYAADAKAQLVASMNISATAVTMAIYANVVTGVQTITSPSWVTGVDTSNAAKFFAAYGDSFVSSVTSGAQYIALFTFYTTSVSEQIQLVASINATAPTWSALTQANLQEIVNTASCEYSMQQIIIGASNLSLPDENGLIAFASAFPTITLNAPQLLSYTTTGYESVPNPPWSTTSPVVGNRQLFQSTATQINELTGIQNAFGVLQSLYSTYGYTDPSLAGPLSTLQSDVQNVVSWVQQLGADPTASVLTAPPFKTLQNPTPLPVPNFSLQSSAAFGGERFLASLVNVFQPPAASNFGDVTENQIAAGITPTSVTLYNDTIAQPYVICGGVSIVYSDGSTFVAGSGTAAATLQLQAGEYVSGMSGQQFVGANLLTLTTNNNNSASAGASIAGQTPFSWSPAAGQTFVGFTGQTLPVGGGAWLADIAAQYVVFAPANWQALPS